MRADPLLRKHVIEAIDTLLVNGEDTISYGDIDRFMAKKYPHHALAAPREMLRFFSTNMSSRLPNPLYPKRPVLTGGDDILYSLGNGRFRRYRPGVDEAPFRTEDDTLHLPRTHAFTIAYEESEDNEQGEGAITILK